MSVCGVFPTHRQTQSISRSTHYFHDVRAPLRQQLQTPQSQVEQLSVFLVGLLAVQARARHHFAVAVARQLRDEADVVLPDLHHLLTQVVLRRDAALSARPPGHRMEPIADWCVGGTVVAQWWNISNMAESISVIWLHRRPDGFSYLDLFSS